MPPAVDAPVQIDYAKVARMLAAAIQTAVLADPSAFADLDPPPAFLFRGEPTPNAEGAVAYVRLVSIDYFPVPGPRIAGHAHHAAASISLTLAVRERGARPDLLSIDRLAAAASQALRGPALVDGDTLVEFTEDPTVDHDAEADPLTGYRTCGLSVAAAVRRGSGNTFETIT